MESLLELERQYHEHLVKLTRKTGLTFAEWQLLVNIEHQIDTQEKLSALMNLNVSTLSRQLGRLLAKEFVTKVPADGKQGRRYFIYAATAQGEKAIEQLEEEFHKFDENLFRHWAQEEQNLLQILLNRLNKSMERLE
ncbi:MAG: MarR family transcriptional regulator [Liquorilactobacillus satsumensis]|uniref:Transcriptional regulator n=2 Tax=Liquorilactobacillus satsumensis TaxID=259059 RepID=A0A0R1V0H0_9LACO|nr:transcriptional regulator [Liquorilactobacillus satsumensis DSM 16230 = JCM 12392]